MPTETFFNLPKEKRDRIFNAAVKEFGLRNLAEGNLSNIVKDSGISRGSLYQYFTTKEDLYVYLFDTLRAARGEYVKPAYDLYKKAPFLDFFAEFYLRDSEFLIMNPSHIELGKKLYSGSDSVSRGLIQRIQTQYKEKFLGAVEFDKEKGLISPEINSSIFTDLCVHFVTDIFIFQSIHSQFSMENIKDYCGKTLYILEKGIAPRN